MVVSVCSVDSVDGESLPVQAEKIPTITIEIKIAFIILSCYQNVAEPAFTFKIAANDLE